MSAEIVREIERRIAESDSPPEIFWTQKLLDRLKARPIQPVSELVKEARRKASLNDPKVFDSTRAALYKTIIDIHSEFFLKLADALEASEARAERYRVALEFYADPGTYFAIGFIGNSPCGPFMDDGSDDYDDPDIRGVKPGKRAREALGGWVMPDISKCEGIDCPLKEKCYRWYSKPSMRQSYADFWREQKDGKCEHYWPRDGDD